MNVAQETGHSRRYTLDHTHFCIEHRRRTIQFRTFYLSQTQNAAHILPEVRPDVIVVEAMIQEYDAEIAIIS